MPNQSNRLRFERKQVTDDELMVWDWLKQTYGRQAAEVLMSTVVTLYKPHVLQLQGKPTEAQLANREAWIYCASVIGTAEIPDRYRPDVSTTLPLPVVTDLPEKASPTGQPTDYELETDF